ncbi:MAG: dihydroorotate dehydrogenase [Spirochaetia bacterium]|nr:dihydroorotate dehydrogenase [Spirochaetia bacterium]MCF7941319.1 dihydroorotate dehydrogenase [Spirochaetia bacterium]
MRDRQAVLSLLKGNHRQKQVVLGTVSGVVTTKTALIEHVDRNLQAVGLITTKSFQVEPNSGNREPIITEPEIGSFGNSVGLRNPGLETALQEIGQLRARTGLRALLNVSVSASTPQDFISLVRAFGELADCIELNFSCPHASEGYGASIGCDPVISEAYMRAIRDAVGDDFPALIIPKLTPNVESIGTIARALVAAGADGIAAINTVGPVQYLEPHSGAPILNNAIEGKGGMSGEWVRERALEAVREIREAVGDEVPIIGMGGVSTGADAAALIEAGADTVGIGSAFGRVHQRSWAAWTDAIAQDARQILNGGRSEDHSSVYLADHRQMEFFPCTITRIHEHASGVKVLYTDGSLECGPGQYAFIWLPGAGEKPFSIAESSPLTFIIKERGPFTAALLQCTEGDTIYVRGVYGESVEIAETANAVILAGGTGLAVVPSLLKRLQSRGVRSTIYYGVSGQEEAPLLQQELSAYGTYIAVADDGIPGRVIDVMDEAITEVSDTAFYTIGPEPFMSRASQIMSEKGIPDTRIFLSMERPSLCGIGMCGECACGDRLTCQYGTFMQLDFLKEQAPELL